MAEPARAGGLAVPSLLRQMAEELGALQAMAADLEGAVDALIAQHAGALDAGSLRTLQLLDIMGQSLAALKLFAARAATLAEPSWRLDAAAAAAELTLASLAQRLATGQGPAATGAGDDCELFS